MSDDDCIEQAMQYLSALFRDDDWIEFRLLPGTVSRWVQLARRQEVSAALQWAMTLNSREDGPKNVYCGVNPRADRNLRGDENVTLARSVFADFDGGCTVPEAMQKAEAARLPRPSFVIESGGGVHLYWLLADDVHDLAKWSEVQRGIARAAGSDRTIHNPERIMRLPGPRNVKESRPGRPRCRIVKWSDALHDIAAFPTFAPPAPAALTPARLIAPGSMGRISKEFFESTGTLPSGRRQTMFTVACDLAARGWKLENAVPVIMKRMADIGLTAEELADCPRQIRNAFNKPREPAAGDGSLSAGGSDTPQGPAGDDQSQGETTLEEAFTAGLLEMLRDGELAPEHAAAVAGEMLRDRGCRAMFSALAVLAGTDSPTLADLSAELRRQWASAEPERLERLVTRFVAAGTGHKPFVSLYAAEIAAQYRQRRGLDLLADAAERVRRGEPASVVLAEVLDEHVELTAGIQPHRTKTITFVDCCNEWASHERAPVIATGLKPFDTATQGGLPRGAVTGFVAPPGGCKSAMALQLVLGALHADKDLRAVYGLGEMTPQEIAERYACTGAFVYELEPVSMRQASSRHSKARNVLGTLAADMGDRLTFVQPPLTVASMAAEVARTGAKLVVIDYLQLVRGEGSSKVEELDGIVDELQQMAVARDLAVVVISSMAKATGQQARAHEWARGSGQIGYALKLLYVGERDEHADQDGTYGFRWLCRKARSIPEIDVELRWDPDCQTFTAAERPVAEFEAFAPGRPR